MAEVDTEPPSYPLPLNEEERLRELHAVWVEGGRFEQIERICRLARDLFKVPVALVPLVGRDELTFLAVSGIELDRTTRNNSFCTYTILGNEPLIVEDARLDPRFAGNCYVTGEPHIRFYASTPLSLRPGINIGTLSIYDFKPRRFSADDAAHLAALAEMIVSEMRARRAERDLRSSEKRLAQTARLAKVGGYDWNVATNELTWDDQINEIYGIPHGTTPRHDLVLNTYDKDTRKAARRRLEALFKDGTPYDVELRGTRSDGEEFWIHAMAEAEITDGKVTRVFGAVRDVTDHQRASLRIHELALHDPLTDLPNRVSFMDRLNKAISAATASGHPVHLLKFNIDHFRDVNDALGHHTGDQLLKTVADALSQSFCNVARFGSDEFTALVPGAQSPERLDAMTRDFIARARTMLSHDLAALPLGISTGVASYPAHGGDADAVIKNAKVALLQAKTEARGGVIVFDPAMRKAADEKNALMRRVAAGIAKGEFILFYQPIVGLRRACVNGLEALMRWNDPEHGILPPAAFMAAFDEPELAVALGDVALDLAIKQMRAWLDAGIDFGNVAINLSTAQFRLGNLADRILARLEEAGVPPQHLTLEVTENVYMAWGADVVTATVHKLHAAGVGIALDDFGTGYASLAHLRQFPIDKLKIDKSFIQSAESVAIVDAVINMGLSLGMQIVAEGVEKIEQLELLRLKGCDYVQGYIFAKPLAADQVPGYIAGFTAPARRLLAAAR